MPAPYEGKCLCGGVEVTIKSEPGEIISCFCDHCRIGAGGTNQLLTRIPEEDVLVRGEDLISVYELKDTSSGQPKQKAFCRVCATPLWTVPGPIKGKYRNIRLAYLEGRERFKPHREICTRTRPAWVPGVSTARQNISLEEMA